MKREKPINNMEQTRTTKEGFILIHLIGCCDSMTEWLLPTGGEVGLLHRGTVKLRTEGEGGLVLDEETTDAKALR